MTLLWRKVLECSSSLLTSSSLWSHSYGGRFWSVLPHTAHFVIPVISLTSSSLALTPITCLLTHLIVIPDFSLESSHPSHLIVIPVISHPSLVFSPISSLSLTSLSSHLTQVIPDYSLSHHSCYHSFHTQCSHTHPHSLHSPSHLIVIPGYSLPSLVLPCSLIPAFSLTSLLWVLTPITCLLTLTISHRVSPHALSHPSHLCHHTEWSHITCVLRECLFPLPWCRTTTKSTLTLSSLSHTLPSMSSLWTLPWCRTTTKSTHSLLWENLCSHSHSHGVVLPPSLPTHCSERTCAPTHTSMVSYYHQVYPLTLTLSSLSHTLPWCRTTTKSSHTHTNPCAPTHSHVLTHSAPLTSFHLILTTNSSQLISHTLPPIMPPSHHHHLITSSYHLSPPIASSHSIQFIPPLSITPNPPNRLLNPLQSQFIPITTIVAPHRLPNNIKPIQSRRWDKPQGLAGQSQLIPSQYPLHTKSSTKDCTDNTISFNTIQIVFLYPKRIKYSYVKYILSL